jgi:LysM repeat protein
MILDQLFEDDKKKLNEIDPRNYDSDWDYYNDRDAEEPEDDDVDPPEDNDYDPPNDEESYYEKSLRSRGLGESRQRRLNEDLLLEYTVFRQARQFGQLLVEYNLTKAQVQQLFKDVEQGATAAGGNRTGLGKAKDATTNAIGSVQNMLASARKWVKERPTYQAVDTEYNRAMTALGKVGGNSGEANAITKAIYKYRDAAKKYPRAAGLAKWAIITAAGLATGGVGGAGVAAGLAAIDSALKDKELVDIVGDAGIAALVSGGIQGAGDLASAASDAYNGVPSASDIAANNAALGNWNDTDIPGGPASNINGLDLPPDQVAGLTTDGTPNIVGPEAEGLTPEELANAAAQAKAYGFDGDVTLDQLNQAIMQTAEPGTVPADYSQLGAGAGSSTYTVTADDFKGLGKIAQDNGLTAQQLWDANPQITDPDKIFIGQEINIPAASGEPVKNVWQDWEGGTKPTAPAVEPGPGDTVPKLTFSNPNSPQPVPDGSAPNTNPIVGKNTFPDGTPIERTPYGNSSQEYMKQFGGSQPNQGGSGFTGTKVAGMPVIPGQPLNPTQMAIADFSMQQGNQLSPVVQSAYDLAKRGAVRESVWSKVAESVKFKIIPAEQLIDQKLTVLSWALNESVNRKGQQSIHLTTKGVRTVFENIGRYRRAYLKEYTGAPTADYGHPTAAGAPASATAGQGKPQGWFGRGLDAIGKGVDKVGSWASNAGHNVITKVTADKLNNMWNRAGEPYDSDRLYQLLTTEWGVPKQVVDSVFSKMSIPYTPQGDPAKAQAAKAQGGAQRSMPFYGTNPATKKPWTYDELQAKSQAGTTPAPTTQPTAAKTATQPVGFNATNVMKLPGMEKYAKAPATANFAGGPTGYGKTTTSVKPMTGIPGMKAPSAPTAPKAPGIKYNINLPAGGGAGVKAAAAPKEDPQAELKKALDARRAAGLNAYESKTNEARILQALKRPVAEMLQMVETKEDVARIKQFVDQTFVKYGTVTESSVAIRNRLIEHVTQVGAQRRREFARRG